MSTGATLSESDSKALLIPYGLPVTEERLVESTSEAVRAATDLGFPVAAKLAGESIAHKTERGLVRLNLADPAAIEQAATELLELATPADGQVSVLVAPMIRGNRELIVGMLRDPQFGPTVMLGLGGVLAEAVAEVVFRPAPLDAINYRGFTAAYCSSLVHDVNAVHGLLDGLGVPDGEIAGAQLFAGGEGGQGAVRLLGGRALWNMVHLKVPALADYREHITFYFDEGILELEFPSPWLNHQPTRLTVKKSDGYTLVREDVRTGYEEAFIEELKGFWSAIVEGKGVRNTAEQARRDMRLLSGLAQFHATHTPQPQSNGAGS